MKQVVCTGLAVLDHVFQLPTIPKTPVKSFACNYIQVGGGNAATAAVALNRAGGQAVYWGRLGDDHNGNIILAELEEFGVDVLDVLRKALSQDGLKYMREINALSDRHANPWITHPLYVSGVQMQHSTSDFARLYQDF